MMDSNYNSPDPHYSQSANLDFSPFVPHGFASDATSQPSSHSMMYTNSNGSNGGWNDSAPSHNSFAMASHPVTPSNLLPFDPSPRLGSTSSFDPAPFLILGSGSSASQGSQQQYHQHQQQTHVNHGRSPQRQPVAQQPQQQQQQQHNNHHHQQPQRQQPQQPSQEILMAQMMNFANTCEYNNGNNTGALTSAAQPVQTSMSTQSASRSVFAPSYPAPGRLQRTSSMSSAPIEFNAIPVRPTNQARSKSHSVAEGFGMMGPPPRPTARMPHPTTLSPFARNGHGSPQNSPVMPAYQPYSPVSYGSPSAQQQAANHSSPEAQYSSSEAGASSSGPRPFPASSTFSTNPTRPSSPFDSDSRGLATMSCVYNPNNSSGNAGVSQSPWSGSYSSSGFDMVGVLSRVASRPNPQLALGPVDLGCSFLVVDARKFDQPIIFASETFSRLTGYSNEEIMGRNCRFMQAPDGQVVQGEKRKYTDGNAAFHIRRHIMQGKESQASMINYCKGGRPFINLITVIPITWDSDEIAYYVGFQVDLVEQPSAIMEKMKNGSYAIDYRLVNSNLPREVSAPSIEAISVDHLEEITGGSALAQRASVHSSAPEVSMDVDTPDLVLDQVDGKGPSGIESEFGKKMFNRMLLENCDDFVHVLSLKGSLLYVSPSSKRLLEYEPHGLVGKSLSSFCHPSDIVSVLRELKESGSSSHASVDLVFRFRRKHSGYTWIEAHGKLHLEQGKGRKCVILVGRVRDVYKMSWSDLERSGGFGKQEYWSKLTSNGMHLYSTPNVSDLLGYSSEEMIGKTFNELSPDRDVSQVLKALDAASKGIPGKARHRLVNKDGVSLDVVTHFFPSRSQTDEEPSSPRSEASIDQFTVIAQTNSLSSEMAKDQHAILPSAPSVASRNAAAQIKNQQSVSPSTSTSTVSSRPSLTGSGSSSANSSAASSSSSLLTLPSFNMSARGSADSESTSGTSTGKSTTFFSAITSTYMTLQTNNISDNIFDELDSVRGTSWQFELHQMRLTNKKLREEKEALLALQAKKRRREAGQRSDPGKTLSETGVRACLNCGKTQSAEWRTGPTGPKTLCNACGLRWSKAKSTVAKASGVTKSPKSINGSPAANAYPTPSSSGKNSISPFGGATTPIENGSGPKVAADQIEMVFASPREALKPQRPQMAHSAYSTG